MFKSLALGSMSVASTSSASKSSAASSYDSSSKSSKWENDLAEKELEIYKLSKYEISCLEDGSDSQGWAEFGIGFLNFCGGNYDYSDHWFLIAETKPKNFMKDVLGKYCGLMVVKLWVTSWALADSTNEKKRQEKKIELEKLKSNFYEPLILLLDPKNKDKESNPFKFLHEIYKKEIMEDMVQQLKDIKNGKKDKLDCEKLTEVYYFLIEKGQEGKTVKYYKNVDDILKAESENYHFNKADHKEDYYMNNKKITIKDLNNFVRTLSDSYNLIDDNCQDFVRNILKHYNLV